MKIVHFKYYKSIMAYFYFNSKYLFYVWKIMLNRLPSHFCTIGRACCGWHRSGLPRLQRSLRGRDHRTFKEGFGQVLRPEPLTHLCPWLGPLRAHLRRCPFLQPRTWQWSRPLRQDATAVQLELCCSPQPVLDVHQPSAN